MDFINYLDDSETDFAKDYDAYCKNIETTAVWGGQVEVRINIKTYKIHFCVLKSKRNKFELITHNIFYISSSKHYLNF